MTIIKDFDYYETELKAILSNDVDTLKQNYGFSGYDSIEDYIAAEFASWEGETVSGFRLNKMFEIDSAIDDDAYVVFVRDNLAQYAVGHNGDYIVNKGNRYEVYDENNTDNALYNQACRSEGFKSNDFNISDYEDNLRAEDGGFSVKNGDIQPLKRRTVRPN